MLSGVLFDIFSCLPAPFFRMAPQLALKICRRHTPQRRGKKSV